MALRAHKAREAKLRRIAGGAAAILIVIFVGLFFLFRGMGKREASFQKEEAALKRGINSATAELESPNSEDERAKDSASSQDATDEEAEVPDTPDEGEKPGETNEEPQLAGFPGGVYLKNRFDKSFLPYDFFCKHIALAPLESKEDGQNPGDAQGEAENLFLDIGAEIQAPQASLTKIMTVILALEKISDLNAEAPVDTEIYQKMVEENSSMAGFFGGEKTSYRDLIYGTMLASGGEAANSLALNVAGGIDEFTRLMNEKASELGLKNTHYTNPEGLDAPNHYSSAADCLRLLRYALQNEEFRKVFTTDVYMIDPNPYHQEGLNIVSTVLKEIHEGDEKGFKILGGKSGTTFAAGECWATLVEKNEEEYIAVVMGSPISDLNVKNFGQKKDTLHIFEHLIAD